MRERIALASHPVSNKMRVCIGHDQQPADSQHKQHLHACTCYLQNILSCNYSANNSPEEISWQRNFMCVH